MILEAIFKQINKLNAKGDKKFVATRQDPDFIPYVCHYDPSTILTKNGELLQVIRITGFSGDSLAADLVSLRDSLRESIFEHIKENKFALWIHTIRRKKNIVPSGEYPDFFSNSVNEDWVKKNNWNDQYVNELYITIIIEGFDTSIQNYQAFSRSLSYSATHKLHKKFLEESYKELSRVSLKILAEIEEYGAKMLTIKDWNNNLYSEPMRFFGKIVNLHEERYPLSINDISEELVANHKVAFGNRELEVISEDSKNFAAMLSIKEYHEVSTGALERILQLPLEFIITQSFDFAFDKKDIEEHQYQNHILEISGDEDFRQLSGLANFIDSDNHAPTDFCHVQSTVMLINKNKEALEKDISSIVEKFSTLGFILVREDIFSEHCFWAQLPGNFAFLRRQKIINTLRIAGFAALHNFPAGSIDGNYWGPAITTLKTVLRTPYFFSFHDKDLGHSLVLGEKGSGKTTIVNFLLSEARKFNNRIFYFDSNNSSKAFIEGILGDYHVLTKNINDKEFLQINPFSLPKNEENAAFLANWIKELIVFLKGDVAESETMLIPEIINQALSNQSPTFLTAFDLFSDKTKTPALYEKLKIWGSGKLGYIFGSQNECDWKNQVHGFNLDEIISQKPVLIPVVSYLLQKIDSLIDNSAPAIIIFDDAWELLDNEIIAAKLNDFLQKMRKKNCVVIFISNDKEEIAESKISKIINDNIATQIYLANKEPGQHCKTIFGLSEEELDVLKMMEIEDYNFLLKQRGESVIIDLDLRKSLNQKLKILSSDNFTLTALAEIISHLKEDNPEKKPTAQDWLAPISEVIKTIEKEKRDAEIKAAIEAKKAKAKKLEEE